MVTLQKWKNPVGVIPRDGTLQDALKTQEIQRTLIIQWLSSPERGSIFCVIEMINYLIVLLVLAMTGVLDLSSSL